MTSPHCCMGFRRARRGSLGLRNRASGDAQLACPHYYTHIPQHFTINLIKLIWSTLNYYQTSNTDYEINEFKDIQQNNIGTSILVVAILIAITLILKDSISLLISALIPYPETTNFL